MSTTPLVAVVDYMTDNVAGTMGAPDPLLLAAALQHHVTYEFGPVWGLNAKVQLVTPDAVLGLSNAWVLGLFDDSDTAGALGYHDVTNAGKPLGKIFVGTDLKYGYNPFITASHELDEMLADPEIDRCVQVDSHTFYTYEVCDACEADVYGHWITFYVARKRYQTMMTDFVTPAWFMPGYSGPYDFNNHITKPLELLPGGYIGEGVVMNGNIQWLQKSNGETVESRRIPLRNKKLESGLRISEYSA